jgi:hypothetical protein
MDGRASCECWAIPLQSHLRGIMLRIAGRRRSFVRSPANLRHGAFGNGVKRHGGAPKCKRCLFGDAARGWIRKPAIALPTCICQSGAQQLGVTAMDSDHGADPFVYWRGTTPVHGRLPLQPRADTSRSSINVQPCLEACCGAISTHAHPRPTAAWRVPRVQCNPACLDCASVIASLSAWAPGDLCTLFGRHGMRRS